MERSQPMQPLKASLHRNSIQTSSMILFPHRPAAPTTGQQDNSVDIRFALSKWSSSKVDTINPHRHPASAMLV